VKKEGLLFLYKTHWGIKIINNIGNKYKKTLKVLSYISIFIGYCLMAAMFYFLGRIVWFYIFNQNLVRMIKVPPIMPLIPYLPQIFKLDFLPPFYFTYWIIIIAVIAISHEFAHGIFAAYNKVKIKKTGFGFFPFFLPIFLAAFVELDEKEMSKKPKLSQMAILSSGAFANVLTAIIFLFILWSFFSLAFVPAGVIFDTYSYSIVNISDISSINNISLDNPSYEQILTIANETNFSRVNVMGKQYILTKEFLDKQQNVNDYILLYDDAPAVNAGLSNIITEINGIKVESKERLAEELLKYSPGETITIKTKRDGKTFDYSITLGEHPEDNSRPWLGIGFIDEKTRGIIGKIISLIYTLKKPNVYYEARFDAAPFVYNLFWWLVLISISVALINMLPVGIFDGGRFLYLTILGITKNEKKTRNLFKVLTFLILFLAFLLMFFWAISFW